MLALISLRCRSQEFKELEIVVLRHELVVAPRQLGRVRRQDRLGGLVHEYRTAA
jgi:hypothetical protein